MNAVFFIVSIHLLWRRRELWSLKDL